MMVAHCKSIILITFVLVLGLAGSASAYPLGTAVAVWNMDNNEDDNPPFTNLDYFANADVTGMGIDGAEHFDGWAIVSEAESWTPFTPPHELAPSGPVSILVRVRMAQFDMGAGDGIDAIAGIYDESCGTTVPSYAIEFHSGDPTFAVCAAGGSVRTTVSLGQVANVDTWYDILGVFDPVADELRLFVLDPATGSQISSASVPVAFDSLITYTPSELEVFCSPCLELGSISGGFVEVVAVWIGAIEPTGKPRVSNISPEDGADPICPDTELCFQAPYNALCMNPNSDPNLKGPFLFDVYFGSDPCSLVSIAPTIGPIDSNETICIDPCRGNLLGGATYFWRVDINDLNEPGQPRIYEGPVFGFAVDDYPDCGSWAYFPGDLSRNCFVNFVDYSLFAMAWLTQVGDDEFNPDGDVDTGGSDGFIDGQDLAVFADNWLIYTAPTPPSALTFDNITTNSIDISWTDNSPDEIGFYIYVSSSPNQPGVPTYTNSANDVNLTAAGLAPGTTYDFWVTAYNSYCESAAADGNQTTIGGPMYPMSDPNNTGNWVLRADMSDEFEGSSLDTDKWFASGTGGVFMYSWPGRAPSQFAPENIRVENGKLYLTTKWDPNYPFVPEIDPDCGCPYENYTTAAVISNNTFQYGYMEIKCKAADVSITSSFWATGDSSELDVFEFVADSKVYDNDRTYPFCVHDWDHGGRSWCDSVELPWRVGSESHVYGCEWDANGLKFYADGNLVKDAPSSEIGNVWCLDEQMIIWVDSEAFEWEGFPDPEDLPADYEIDYIRVWQK